MNRCKSVRRLLITLLLLLSLVTVPALASGGDTVEISTAEGLMELLSTSYGDCYEKTYGKTFVLTEDITIDTSELETSFNANSAPIRAFDGIFDGGRPHRHRRGGRVGRAVDAPLRLGRHEHKQ